jgi:transposase
LRELRDLCRLRKKRIGSLTAEKNRIQKYLEASNIKLKTVISDVFGVSGRNLLQHLIDKGYVDAEEIDTSVKGSVKNKKAEVADSIFGTMTPHQINLIKDCWEHIEYLEKSIARLEEEIDSDLTSKSMSCSRPFQVSANGRLQPLLQRLGSIWNNSRLQLILHPGRAYRLAITKVQAKKSTKSVKGNPHAKVALCEASWAIARSRKTELSTRFWKIASRRGKKKACIATARKILVIAYHMLKTKQPYMEGRPKATSTAS